MIDRERQKVLKRIEYFSFYDGYKDINSILKPIEKYKNYKHPVKIYFDFDQQEGAIYVYFYEDRLENDEEYNARIESETLKEKQNSKKEYEQYLFLRKKYDPLFKDDDKELNYYV